MAKKKKVVNMTNDELISRFESIEEQIDENNDLPYLFCIGLLIGLIFGGALVFTIDYVVDQTELSGDMSPVESTLAINLSEFEEECIETKIVEKYKVVTNSLIDCSWDCSVVPDIKCEVVIRTNGLAYEECIPSNEMDKCVSNCVNERPYLVFWNETICKNIGLVKYVPIMD